MGSACASCEAVLSKKENSTIDLSKDGSKLESNGLGALNKESILVDEIEQLAERLGEKRNNSNLARLNEEVRSPRSYLSPQEPNEDELNRSKSPGIPSDKRDKKKKAFQSFSDDVEWVENVVPLEKEMDPGEVLSKAKLLKGHSLFMKLQIEEL